MQTIEIARKLAALERVPEAQKAYSLALGQGELTPEEELEAAGYIFFSKGDHRIAFTSFVSLYNRGLFQNEILDVLMQGFYLPNVERQKKQYQKNVKALSQYPYFFRKDFPTFEELPILFFPFDKKGFVPFDLEQNRFGDYVNFDDTIIDRWFFKDLSKPILADDVYSQYQLEYLNDNVRKSEWVAKENHIYLHYTDFAKFCAYLPVLNFKKLLNDEKLVFLMEEEVSRYPIDFKQEYGIDYSEYPVKPLGIREIKRLIWHTQLSSDNGGDFFNEILYGHPNLLAYESIMFDNFKDSVYDIRSAICKIDRSDKTAQKILGRKELTDTEALIAYFLYSEELQNQIDPAERIVPAILFQPHFGNIYYTVRTDPSGSKVTTLYSKQYEVIQKAPFLKGFKYIKTFTPMRRPTTSYTAMVRTVVEKLCVPEEERETTKQLYPDLMGIRLVNRSYLVDEHDRLMRDSRLVRFEDGKVNPTATFTALAEFLDIPYTHSMTYCSSVRGVNTASYPGNAVGFDTRTVYATYDDYANDEERAYLEYFTRDAYEAYGYDFHYYKGEPVDEEWVKDKIAHFTTLDNYIKQSWFTTLNHNKDIQKAVEKNQLSEKQKQEIIENKVKEIMEDMQEERLAYAKALLRGLYFVNKDGQPLHMMTPLKLDPELLEKPMYH